MSGGWVKTPEIPQESSVSREYLKQFVHDPQAALASDLRRRFKKRFGTRIYDERSELKELKHAA